MRIFPIALAMLVFSSIAMADDIDVKQPFFPDKATSIIETKGLVDLRGRGLEEHGDEVRLWILPAKMRGGGVYMIRNKDQKWSGRYITTMAATKSADYDVEPNDGWNQFWSNLLAEGLLTLPDSSELEDDGVIIFDGVGYLVEVLVDNQYRSYYYSNPRGHKQPEAQSMSKIIEICKRGLQKVTPIP